MTECPKCHGDGEITVYPSGSTQDPRAYFTTCPKCRGVGMIKDHR